MSDEKPSVVKVEAPATIKATLPLGEPAQVGDKNIAPTTTAAEDLVHLGQRRINMVWEFTQASVTLLITLTAVYLAVAGKESDMLENAFFVVVSTYLARTNHTKIGGVGMRDTGR